jgi:AcrR family transcriptional regulator
MLTTRARLIRAATELFSELGYVGTSIGKVEERAGLAPRAGGFYRHFKSKEDLLEAVLDAEIDTPENTGAVASFDLGDTRAELIAIGRAYLAMNRKNRDLVRVFEREAARVPAMQAKSQTANEEAMTTIAEWITGKPGGTGLAESQVTELALMIFGAWFFYIQKTVHQDISLPNIEEESLLKNWATFWAKYLDDECNAEAPRGLDP